ncbi:FAD-dependent monooxygenase [Streptomyces sp. NPDC048291]|uniref:FAD-dependent monooxygenase n=1 Tax=Streptomyces sp. NPDC048291 TaxID=3365530 RepID=UPI00371E7AB8
MRPGTEALSVVQNEHSVTLTCTTGGGGRHETAAAFVVGCGGANSIVRPWTPG